MSRKKANDSMVLLRDAGVVVLSIFIAVILVQTHIPTKILATTQEMEWLGSFVAGLFFTSVFTTAPAIATLGEIARVNSILNTAFLGAIGAVIGDLIIFRFVKDQLSEHIVHLLKQRTGTRRLRALFKYPLFRWLTFFVGGLVIASPLPDELGISLMGFSKMRTFMFIPVSFIFNFLGIVLIGLVARSL